MTDTNRQVTSVACLAIADSGMCVPPDEGKSLKSATDTDSMKRELFTCTISNLQRNSALNCFQT